MNSKTQQRRIAGLTLLLMGPFVALLLGFWGQKIVLKESFVERMEQEMDTEKRVTFRLSKTDAKQCISWENAREFRYKGHLYDLIKQKESKDSITYICWQDSSEEKLEEQERSMLIACTPFNLPMDDSPVDEHFLKKAYYHAAIEEHFSTFPHKKNVQNVHGFSCLGFFEQDSPPPENC